VFIATSKPPPRPVARTFGNGLLSYLRPRIQSICVNLYPTNPAAVDSELCATIERDSVDPGGVAVMISGAKLPPPRSMNEMLQADFGAAIFGGPASVQEEASFGGPVLVATGILDPLNDARGRGNGLAALREGIVFDPINAGHCPHDELPQEVAASIAKWMTATFRPNLNNPATRKSAAASSALR
jgi:pimeloyl-ACP methyl ester carboxylesterase